MFTSIQGEYISSSEDVVDETYIRNIQSIIEGQVIEAKKTLKMQEKVLEAASQEFVSSKVREQMFMALKSIVDKDLESVSKQEFGQLRQEGDDDGDGDSDSDTTKRTVPLIPVLANILRAVYNSTVNLTLLQPGPNSIFRPRPITNPFTGLTNFLGLTKPLTEAPVSLPKAKAASSDPASRFLEKDEESLQFPVDSNTLILIDPQNVTLENSNSTTKKAKRNEFFYSNGGYPQPVFIE